jgi:hypothetical protein
MTSQYTAMRKAYPTLWRKWWRMCQRCNNNEIYYRDVSVCASWNIDISGEQGFINFVEDMGDDFREDLVIDRYPDPKGDYSPDNVRWTTVTENNRNRRFHKYTERGQALTKMYEKWGHSTAVKQRFWSRAKRGWNFEDIVNVPPYQGNRYSKIRHQKSKKSTKPKYFGNIIGWFKPKSSV